MLFRKKYKGTVSLTLEENQFCSTWKIKQKECAYKFKIITNSEYFNFVHQDGKFYGTPLTGGGAIFPFSADPRKEGSRKQKKNIEETKIVTVSSAAKLNVQWGIQSVPIRDKDGKQYRLGANGTFFIRIDPSDGALNANRFYRSLAAQGRTEMTDAMVRDKLSAAFKNQIADVIQTCLREGQYSFTSLIGFGLTPDEALKISSEVYDRIKSIFADNGLTMTEESRSSIVNNDLVVKEI